MLHIVVHAVQSTAAILEILFQIAVAVAGLL